MGAKTCVKLLLFSFTVVFILAGFTSVGTGLWLLFDIGRFDSFFGEYQFLIPAAVLIASGLYIFLVALCGCCGAVKENKCMLGTFFTMLLLIFCAQVAAGVLGFLFKSHVKVEVQREAKIIVQMKYGTGQRKIDNAVDLLQEKLQCCGADTWEDYKTSQWKKGKGMGKSVPESCCVTPSLCTKEQKLQDINKVGCTAKLVDLSFRDLTILGGIGVGLACGQLLGMCFSCCLFFAISSEI